MALDATTQTFVLRTRDAVVVVHIGKHACTTQSVKASHGMVPLATFPQAPFDQKDTLAASDLE